MSEQTGKKKVLLVIPNSRWAGRRPWMMLPHAPLILTAALKDAFDFRILDANVVRMAEEDCEKKIAEIQPDAVLVSGVGMEYHAQYHAVMRMAKAAAPDTVTVMGGIYPTVMSETALADPNVDYVFIGPAEGRASEFLTLALDRSPEAKTFPGTGHREGTAHAIHLVPDNNYGERKLQKPDYSLINIAGYLTDQSKDYQFNSDRPSAPIITSYGCPYNCSFCATRTISGRGMTLRPLEDILEEAAFLKNQHGVGNLIFIDDCLLADRRRIDGLLTTFIDMNFDLTWKAASVSAWHLDDALLELMKRSGCVQITVSVESGSQRVLKELMHKPLKLDIVPGIVRKCKEVGIDVGANFVIGSPGETWEEIRETFRFAEICDFDLAHFHIATPLPKTELYEKAKNEGLLPPDFSFLDPNFFGYGRGYITTDEFTPGELMTLRAYEWDRINFNTPEKRAKAAQMMCLTSEQLTEHRKQTRQKCGVHY